MGKVKNEIQEFTEVCERLYNKGGVSAVIEFINEALRQGDNVYSPIAQTVQYERCEACDNDMPSLNSVCLICGQSTTKVPALSFLEELRVQAQELIDLGDSHEKREGYGMMRVIDAIRPMPNNLYFELMAIGKNEGLQREEIQIHAGENGNIMIVKTDEGFVIDVYGQNDIVDTMAVWEDTLNPLDDEDEPFDPNNFSLVEKEDFIDEWGQYHDEVCAELGVPDSNDADDILMVDYFWYQPQNKWIPKCSSLYTERQQAIADYLRLG